MTIDISANNPRISYSVASGVTQTSFTVPFEFFDDSDLNVYIDTTLQTITTNYTVAGGAGSTGTITMSVTGPKTVILTRDTTIERTTDFTAGVDINRAALNTQLDTLTAISADNKDFAERSIRIVDYDPATANLLLPDAATRADKLLSFDTEGDVSVQAAADLLTGSVLGANYTKASYTGDGTQTAYSTVESAGSKNNIQVYVDGVYQNKATFSISGATLTFTEAPPLNSAIEFIVGNAVTSLTTDPAVVNYNQGGTGAQDRTLTSKLQDIVSVKDFGAVGNGVADDTAAIQAAINAAKNKKLYIPSGTYRITSTLQVVSPNYAANDTLDIFGDGQNNTTIVTSSDITALKIQDTAGEKGGITGVGFLNDGNTYSGSGVVVFNNSNSIGILVQDCFQYVINNCKIEMFSVGIKLHNFAYWTEGTKIINTYSLRNNRGILMKRENTSATESYSHTLIAETNIQIPKDNASGDWGEGITVEGVTGGTGPAELYNAYIQANLWTSDSVGTSVNLARYLLLTQKGRISNSHINMVFERFGKIQLNGDAYIKNSFTFFSSLDPSQVTLEDNNTNDANKFRSSYRGNLNFNSVNMSEANWEGTGYTATLDQGLAYNSATAFQFGLGTGLSFPFVTSLSGSGNGFFYGTTPDYEDNVTWRFKVDHNGKVYPQNTTAWLEAGTGATTTGMSGGGIKMRTDTSRSSDLTPLWVGIGPDDVAAPVQIIRGAVTGSRPSSPAAVGQMFFDTTLGKPIWWNGSNWVDATGSTV